MCQPSREVVSKWLGGGGASLARAVLKFGGGGASLASKKKTLRLTVFSVRTLTSGVLAAEQLKRQLVLKNYGCILRPNCNVIFAQRKTNTVPNFW